MEKENKKFLSENDTWDSGIWVFAIMLLLFADLPSTKDIELSILKDRVSKLEGQVDVLKRRK